MKTSLFTMKLLVVCFTLWQSSISFTQIMMMEPSEILKSKILMTIKTRTITECWVECQKITSCKTIGTNCEKKSETGAIYNCHLLGNYEEKPKYNEETFFKFTEIRPFPVSYFEFLYPVICSYQFFFV